MILFKHKRLKLRISNEIENKKKEKLHLFEEIESVKNEKYNKGNQEDFLTYFRKVQKLELNVKLINTEIEILEKILN